MPPGRRGRSVSAGLRAGSSPSGVPRGRRGPPGAEARSGYRLPSPRSGNDVPRGPGGIDADPVFQVPPPLRPAMALASLSLAAQRPVQSPPGLPVPLEVLVELLVADRPLAFPGEPLPDFCRAPLLPDQGLHPLPVRNPDPGSMALGPAGQTALLRLLGPVAPLPLVAANLPRNRRFVHPKLLRRLGLVQPGFTVGVNLVSLLLGERRVVLQRSPFDWLVGKTTILPPLAHSARQRSCTSKLNSPRNI